MTLVYVDATNNVAGSIKFYGAQALARAHPHLHRGLFVTASTGNWALALCLSFPTSEHIAYVPDSTPSYIVRALRHTAIQTVRARDFAVAEQKAQEVAERMGGIYIGYDEPVALFGMAHWLQHNVPQGVRAIAVPAAGGSIVAAAAQALQERKVKVYAVCPRGAAGFANYWLDPLQQMAYEDKTACYELAGPPGASDVQKAAHRVAAGAIVVEEQMVLKAQRRLRQKGYHVSATAACSLAAMPKLLQICAEAGEPDALRCVLLTGWDWTRANTHVGGSDEPTAVKAAPNAA